MVANSSAFRYKFGFRFQFSGRTSFGEIRFGAACEFSTNSPEIRLRCSLDASVYSVRSSEAFQAVAKL